MKLGGQFRREIRKNSKRSTMLREEDRGNEGRRKDKRKKGKERKGKEGRKEASKQAILKAC